MLQLIQFRCDYFGAGQSGNEQVVSAYKVERCATPITAASSGVWDRWWPGPGDFKGSQAAAG